jgi:hypothetical protein
MGFQFLNLFSGQAASVSHLAVPFDVSHRPHSRNDGGYGRVNSLSMRVAFVLKMGACPKSFYIMH